MLIEFHIAFAIHKRGMPRNIPLMARKLGIKLRMGSSIRNVTYGLPVLGTFIGIKEPTKSKSTILETIQNNIFMRKKHTGSPAAYTRYQQHQPSTPTRTYPYRDSARTAQELQYDSACYRCR